MYTLSDFHPTFQGATYLDSTISYDSNIEEKLESPTSVFSILRIHSTSCDIHIMYLNNLAHSKIILLLLTNTQTHIGGKCHLTLLQLRTGPGSQAFVLSLGEAAL